MIDHRAPARMTVFEVGRLALPEEFKNRAPRSPGPTPLDHLGSTSAQHPFPTCSSLDLVCSLHLAHDPAQPIGVIKQECPAYFCIGLEWLHNEYLVACCTNTEMPPGM